MKQDKNLAQSNRQSLKGSEQDSDPSTHSGCGRQP